MPKRSSLNAVEIVGLGVWRGIPIACAFESCKALSTFLIRKRNPRIRKGLIGACGDHTVAVKRQMEAGIVPRDCGCDLDGDYVGIRIAEDGSKFHTERKNGVETERPWED